MAWTTKQQRCAAAASGKAGWNDRQRYMAMLHAGCPKSKSGQVSLRGPNPHAAFEQFMALAESAAAQRGEHIYPPEGKASWSQVATGQHTRTIRLIESIWHEAASQLNTKFHAGGLDGFVQRMTKNDSTQFGNPLPPKQITDCDSAQLYRILEGLKAWVAREFIDRGIRPESFQLTKYQDERLRHIQLRSA